MEIPVPLQPLDGDNLFALDRGRLCQARAHGPPVNQNGASAALPLAAAVFRTGQIKLVAQHAEQGALAVNLDAAPGSVDLKFQDSHNPSENHPRRNEEREVFFRPFFVFFVSSWLILIL